MACWARISKRELKVPNPTAPIGVVYLRISKRELKVEEEPEILEFRERDVNLKKRIESHRPRGLLGFRFQDILNLKKGCIVRFFSLF